MAVIEFFRSSVLKLAPTYGVPFSVIFVTRIVTNIFGRYNSEAKVRRKLKKTSPRAHAHGILASVFIRRIFNRILGPRRHRYRDFQIKFESDGLFIGLGTEFGSVHKFLRGIGHCLRPHYSVRTYQHEIKMHRKKKKKKRVTDRWR